MCPVQQLKQWGVWMDSLRDSGRAWARKTGLGIVAAVIGLGFALPYTLCIRSLEMTCV